MKEKDAYIGMKVTPFQKTYGVERWKDFNFYKSSDNECPNSLRLHSFLYVIRKEKDGYCVLSNSSEQTKGDYFNYEDFEPYMAN